MRLYNPGHPGRILKQYLEGGGISITLLAERVGMARKTISEIIHGRARITPPVARKLAKALHTDAGIWLRLQAQHDEWELSQASEDDIKHIVPFEFEKTDY